MDLLISILTDYGIYILASAFIFTAIAVIAISNAEDCPYPAECFDCKSTACHECPLLTTEDQHSIRMGQPTPLVDEHSPVTALRSKAHSSNPYPNG